MTARAPPNPHIDFGAPSWLNHLRCSLQGPLQAVIYTALLVALALFSVSQAFALAAHERLCRFLGLSPCQVHGPRESAVVIVGGDDDLGRHLALNFSQQGYTVFALCPEDRQPAGDTSNVSSLIQEWHQRIKRSGESTPPWGLVAPIVLDMTSGAQRTRAFETVDAYCATHCLHLVAVIVLPAPSFIAPKPARRAGLSISAWGDLVRGFLVDPISVVEDYVGLLSAASGRVVLLLAPAHEPWIPPLHREVLRSVARYLRQGLDVLGIKISLVAVGPSAPVSKPAELTGSETGCAVVVTRAFEASLVGPLICAYHGRSVAPMCAPKRRGVYIPSLRNTIEDVLSRFAVRHEDVWRVVQRVLLSRHPGEDYTIGLHAALQEFYESLPTSLHLCLQSIVPYFS